MAVGGRLADPSAAYRAALAGKADIAAVRTGAGACRACDLWARATQTVFGQGAVPARWMLVGEQPGDREDLAGAPFVGPAGRLLDRALEAAGIDREASFVTNVVKHFKWRPSGKRRLHERPDREEVGACLPWVQAELELVKPSVLVLMGATAAQGMLGSAIRVTRDRGRSLASDLAPHVLVTIHPSAVLRAGGSAERAAAEAGLIEDLRVAAQLGAEERVEARLPGKAPRPEEQGPGRGRRHPAYRSPPSSSTRRRAV